MNTLTGMTVEQFSRLSRREMALTVVAWLRQERMMAPYVLNEIEQVVARLPSGSLSLAVRKGVLFEKAARGVRKDGEGRGSING